MTENPAQPKESKNGIVFGEVLQLKGPGQIWLEAWLGPGVTQCPQIQFLCIPGPCCLQNAPQLQAECSAGRRLQLTFTPAQPWGDKCAPEALTPIPCLALLRSFGHKPVTVADGIWGAQWCRSQLLVQDPEMPSSSPSELHGGRMQAGQEHLTQPPQKSRNLCFAQSKNREEADEPRRRVLPAKGGRGTIRPLVENSRHRGDPSRMGLSLLHAALGPKIKQSSYRRGSKSN